MKKRSPFQTRKRVPFIEQMQQTECALCCMAMIASYYKNDLSMYELRERMGNGRDGTSLLHLKHLGQQLKFNSKSYKVDTQQLRNLILPAILYWENSHFVILEKITPQAFVIIDPGSGRRKVREKEFAEKYSGYALTLYPGDDFEQRKRKNIWASFSYLVTDRPKIFITILFLTFLLQLFTVAMPVLIQFVIDRIIVPNYMELLNVFLVGISGLILFHSLFTFIRGKTLITLHNALDYDIQSKFFKHLLKLPYQFFLLRSFGDLLFRANSMKVIRDQLANQVVKGLLDSAVILVILLYMFIQSPLMAVIVILIGSSNVMLIALSQRYLSETNQMEIKEHSEVQGAQTEMLYGIFGVKTSGVEKMIYDRWLHRFKNLMNAYRKKENVLNRVNTVSSTLQLMAPLIILWVGAHQVFAGSITLGMLVAFHSISGQFFMLSGNIVQTINSFILTTSYLKRVGDVLDAPEESGGDKVKMTINGDIQLKNVTFAYSKYSENIINNVSLNIKKGQKVALVGQSGAGKTTIANMIIGLFTPSAGEIYYDGVSIKDLDLGHLRRQIGTVPQNVMLFNRSIYDNITLHNPAATPEQVIEAAKAAQIHEEIMRMPMQYHTMVSEMGMNISGGQRQRIALAKALLGKPSILVLDEATSSLDHLNESKIDEYLSEINCTRVVIAHRLTTVMNCDLIVVVDKGRIIESGNHHELLQKSSFYSQFYKEMIS
ncbi:peptidase domain-containing ABC transporter [Bacillus halotolerans]|uniref:peptidase domain-containing ABC transporter n=1 Tax=Bacillus halotolerans TaxID=260554 RepID=UPI001879B87C|nr:peptidase domain-containing ABC transporter [Bacillus halotolerans]MEC1543695.1 peptidase domain-containing ABC transporter [Bacillus halotolerans]